MPRISSLPRDESLSGNETLVGTDTNTGESRKFILSDIKDYVNNGLAIDTNRIIRFGQVTLSTASGSTAGGIFTQVFTVTGLTASSIVTATFNSSGNGRTIREVEPGTDSLTIRISNVADGAKISYIAIG